MSLLQRVLALAVEYGLIASNPAEGRARRAKTKAPERSYLDSADQIAALLDAASVLDERATTQRGLRRAMLATLVFAGLRIGEALALNWTDVDLASGRLAVPGTKTRAARRQVQMFPALREALSDWRAACGGDGLVFATTNGAHWQPSNVRRRILAPAVEIAREQTPMPDVTPHGLRRTYVSICFKLGIPATDCMASVGHTSAALTLEFYARPMSTDANGTALLARTVGTEHTTAMTKGAPASR